MLYCLASRNPLLCLETWEFCSWINLTDKYFDWGLCGILNFEKFIYDVIYLIFLS
jgi:hypothetical protein